MTIAILATLMSDEVGNYALIIIPMVIGGAIGGIVGGLAVGISVEALLLMLEEALSREDFKRELLQAIDEARVEFNAEIKASVTPAGKSAAVDDKE